METIYTLLALCGGLLSHMMNGTECEASVFFHSYQPAQAIEHTAEVPPYRQSDIILSIFDKSFI